MAPVALQHQCIEIHREGPLLQNFFRFTHGTVWHVDLDPIK